MQSNARQVFKRPQIVRLFSSVSKLEDNHFHEVIIDNTYVQTSLFLMNIFATNIDYIELQYDVNIELINLFMPRM